MKWVLIVLLASQVLTSLCQTTVPTSETTRALNTTTTGTVITTTTTEVVTTSSSDECFSSNTTCQECLSNPKCFYCLEDNSCRTYKVKGIFPEGCKSSKSRWFSCSLNFEALLIGIGVSAGVVLMIIGLCVCYCCNKTCKAMSDRSMQRIERKINRQRDFLKQKNAERRKERDVRNDAIRVKYGLKPNTYQSLEE